MKKFYRVLPTCVLIATALTAGVATADVSTYTAYLQGANEVPAVTTAATGTATLTIDSEAGTTMPLHIEFSGLSSTQTAAHVHYGAPGTNGAVEFTLPVGSSVDTSITPVGLFGFSNFASALYSDSAYVNIHSENFPGGEIRGFFQLTDTVADDIAAWGEIKALYR
jgi:hypothetical protein